MLENAGQVATGEALYRFRIAPDPLVWRIEFKPIRQHDDSVLSLVYRLQSQI